MTGGSLRGVQVAGIANVASDVTGVQIAGITNFASGTSTVQVALANVSRQATGAQLGLVNVAEDAEVSVGLFSWITHGTHDAALAATEYGVLAETDQDERTERHLCTARAVVAVRLAGPLSLFAGPTFNVFVDREPRKIEPVGYGWKIGSDVQLWPGFLAGLRLF